MGSLSPAPSASTSYQGLDPLELSQQEGRTWDSQAQLVLGLQGSQQGWCWHGVTRMSGQDIPFPRQDGQGGRLQQ